MGTSISCYTQVSFGVSHCSHMLAPARDHYVSKDPQGLGKGGGGGVETGSGETNRPYPTQCLFSWFVVIAE